MSHRKLLFSLLGFLFIQSSLFIDQSHAQPGEWTWMKGSSGNSGAPVYGTQGVASIANTPPALYEAAEWTDHDGNFWMFGGIRDFSSEYNTLWKFNPATNEWTWVKGSTTCCQAGVYGTLGVPSINNTPGARSWGACSWVDNDGHLWLYGGIGYDISGGYQVLSDLWKYDIATNEWTWVYGPNSGTIAVDYGTLGVPLSLTCRVHEPNQTPHGLTAKINSGCSAVHCIFRRQADGASEVLEMTCGNLIQISCSGPG